MNKQLLTQTIDQRIGDVNLINEPVVEAPLINGGVVEGSYLARKRIGRPAALEIYSIRDVCYAASFGYKPMPSDGYCLLQAEVYLWTKEILPEDELLIRLAGIRRKFPGFSDRIARLMRSEMHDQDLEDSCFLIPHLYDVDKRSRVCYYRNHIYYDSSRELNDMWIEGRNRSKRVGSLLSLDDTYPKRPLKFDDHYITRLGVTDPVRNPQGYLVHNRNVPAPLQYDYLIHELEAPGQGSTGRWLISAPSEGNLCSFFGMAYLGAVGLLYEESDVINPCMSLMRSFNLPLEDKIRSFEIARQAIRTRFHVKRDFTGFTVEETARFFGDFGFKINNQKDFDSMAYGVYIVQNSLLDGHIYMITGTRPAELKGKIPSAWCSHDAMLAMEVKEDVGVPFRLYIESVRKWNRIRSAHVEDDEILGYMNKCNHSAAIGYRINASPYDILTRGNIAVNTLPKYSFILVNGNHWIGFISNELYKLVTPSQPAVKIQIKPKMLIDYSLNVRAPIYHENLHVDMVGYEENINYDMAIFNTKMNAGANDVMGHIDFDLCIYNLIRKIQGNDWAILGGLYHYFQVWSDLPTVSNQETLWNHKEYVIKHPTIKRSTTSKKVILPFSLHGNKTDIPNLAIYDELMVIVFEVDPSYKGNCVTGLNNDLQFANVGDDYRFKHPSIIGTGRQHYLRNIGLAFRQANHYQDGATWRLVDRIDLCDFVSISMFNVIPDPVNRSWDTVLTINDILPENCWSDVILKRFSEYGRDIPIPDSKKNKDDLAIKDWINLANADKSLANDPSDALRMGLGFKNVVTNRPQLMSKQFVGHLLEAYYNNINLRNTLRKDSILTSIKNKGGAILARVFVESLNGPSYLLNYMTSYANNEYNLNIPRVGGMTSRYVTMGLYGMIGIGLCYYGVKNVLRKLWNMIPHLNPKYYVKKSISKVNNYMLDTYIDIRIKTEALRSVFKTPVVVIPEITEATIRDTINNEYLTEMQRKFRVGGDGLLMKREVQEAFFKGRIYPTVPISKNKQQQLFRGGRGSVQVPKGSGVLFA